MTAKTVRGPRKYLRSPEEFGAVDPPDPARLNPTHRYLSAAALAQHEVARQVNEQMTRFGITHEDLADRIDVSAEQLRRLLRGESAMTVERMHQLAQATGLNITTRVERVE